MDGTVSLDSLPETAMVNVEINSTYLRWPMYHGDTNERQLSELHMARKEGRKRNIAVNWTNTSNLQIFS